MSDITKSGVRALVEAGDETAILALFDEDPHRVQRFLKRLACAPDAAHHARTVACFRMLSRERSAGMPEFFRETIRRSLWEMNEEGGNVAWSAPEIAAAVVAGAPERYGRFASYLIMAALDEPTFHPSLRRRPRAGGGVPAPAGVPAPLSRRACFYKRRNSLHECKET